MSLICMEGFEGIHSVVTLVAKYPNATVASVTSDTGRVQGYSLTASTGFFMTPRVAADDVIHMGFGFKASSLTDATLIRIMDNNRVVKATLSMSSLGALSLVGNGTGQSINSTSANGVITTDTWYYIEISMLFVNAASGSYSVAVDETDVISATGVDTVGNGVQVNWQYVEVNFPASGTWWYDDMYWLDGNGSNNNARLGDSMIVGLRPDGDSSVEFDPSSGSNYQAVDDLDPSESDYVDGDSGDEDLYTYENVLVNETIHAVQVNTATKASGTTNASLYSKVGATDGATHVLTPELQVVRQVHDTDPNAVDVWTAGRVNSTNFGIGVP